MLFLVLPETLFFCNLLAVILIWQLFSISVKPGPCIALFSSTLSLRISWNLLNLWPSFLYSSQLYFSHGGKALLLHFFSQ